MWRTDSIEGVLDTQQEKESMERARKNKDKNEKQKTKAECMKHQFTELDENLKNKNKKHSRYWIIAENGNNLELIPPKTKKKGNCLTGSKGIMEKWTKYYNELYKHPIRENTDVLLVSKSSNYDDFPVHREDVEVAIKWL